MMTVLSLVTPVSTSSSVSCHYPWPCPSTQQWPHCDPTDIKKTNMETLWACIICMFSCPVFHVVYIIPCESESPGQVFPLQHNDRAAPWSSFSPREQPGKSNTGKPVEACRVTQYYSWDLSRTLRGIQVTHIKLRDSTSTTEVGPVNMIMALEVQNCGAIQSTISTFSEGFWVFAFLNDTAAIIPFNMIFDCTRTQLINLSWKVVQKMQHED